MRTVLAPTLALALVLAGLGAAAAPIAPVLDHGPHALAMAHRGGAAEAPENTFVAFRHALALGVDVLEMDLQPTKDGVPVVLHDANLNRTTTNCKGKIVNQLKLAEVKACNACATPEFCDLHGFVEIPTLEEVLRAFADERVALNVEIKNIPTDHHTFDPLDLVLMGEVVRLVEAHPEYLPDRILVSSFNFKTTTHLKQIAPWLPVALLTPNPVDAHAELLFAKATGLQALQVTQDGMRAENAKRLADDARALGIALHVWTVDDPARMRLYAAAGVDGIISNEPTLLLRELGR